MSRLVEALKEDFLQVQKSILEGLTQLDQDLATRINLKLLVLQNATQTAPGISQFLQLSKGDLAGVDFSMLFELFTRP